MAIFAGGEMSEAATCKDIRQVAREVEDYSLTAILADSLCICTMIRGLTT